MFDRRFHAFENLRTRFSCFLLVGALVGMSIGVMGCTEANLDDYSSVQASSVDLLCQFAAHFDPADVDAGVPPQICDCLDASSGCEYVDLSGDRRRAVRLGTGDKRTITAHVQQGSRLRFSLASFGVETEVAVIITSADGGSKRQSYTVEQARRWNNIEISLEEFGGTESLVAVSVDGKGDVAFAIPRIITTSRMNSAGDRYNVLLYLIDTLRADHVSAYGYDRITTPFLDELGEGGFVYLNSYSTSAWTRPSTASLLTGLYPSFHQANARMRLPLEVPTIAEIMRAAGWSTWAFVANGNVNAAGLDFEQGFDRFVAIKPRGRQPDADQINELVVPWLDEVGDEPFFLYIHSVDPHAPYNPPESVRYRFTDLDYRGPIVPKETKKKFLEKREPTEEDLVHIMGLYDEEILFQDAMIHELFNALEADQLIEPTYFVITSDHGEEFFEHGYWEHGKKLFEEQIRVPLFVIPPSALEVEPTQITAPVQGVDLVPSILEWVGLDLAEGCIQGKVLPTSDQKGSPSRPVYCEEIRHDSGFDLFSLTDGSSKIITKKNRDTGGRKTWLFDSAVDPGEHVNLSSAESGRVESLLQRLQNFATVELLCEPYPPRPEPDLDREVVDQLRALGYLE